MKMLQLVSGFWGLGIGKDDEAVKKKRNTVQVRQFGEERKHNSHRICVEHTAL